MSSEFEAAHRLFEEQAARTPRQVAVICGGRQLTYGELNAGANQLAHQLRLRGVGPNARAAIAIERSVEMVLSILAVLKTGAAYLPVDPSYPKERVAFMLDDARPAALLTNSKVACELPACEAQAILIDEVFKGCELISENLTDAPCLDDLAYVIYTSGSTGKPKGVMVSHGNLRSYVRSMRHAIAVTDADRYLHTASISFSSSVRQLMLPLSSGATLVVATNDEIRDPISLFGTIKQHGVTIVDFVPSYWRACIDALRNVPSGARSELLANSLRLVLSASEPLLSDLPRAWRNELNHGAQLINMFGQTETTGIVGTYEIDPNRDGEKPGTIPIGRPIDDVRFYLLDSKLRRVPAGESGEICIGGPTVSQGYLNCPEASLEKFPADPFAENSSARTSRIYRTGDLGRLRADGVLEFKGRIDSQVKIRGHRVEPAETEAALLQQEGVFEVAVIASEEQPGQSRLRAFVVPQKNAAPSISGRERYRLPNNMAVVQQNKHETDFFYQQIFVDQTNFRHGIALEDGACVFDVGANIGLFSLFAQQARRNVCVYAFEPIPQIFESLKLNASLYGKDVKLFQCGVAEESKEVEFTFYPNSTSQSGRYGDEQDERQVLRSIIGNVKQGNGDAGRDEYLNALVETRVSGEKVVCRLRTLSEIIREENVARIDLLKIDVEKSEADVLVGIADEDWPKIRQIVIEAHDVDGQLSRLTRMLKNRGYSVIAEQDQYLTGSNLYNVYATRAEQAANKAADSAPFKLPVIEDTILSANDLRTHLQEKLPDYLIPSEIVLVESLPRLPNGKVNREALKSYGRKEAAATEAPQTALTPVEEQLTRIWAEVLDCGPVGVNDNFFDLGGDSIQIMRIISRAAGAGLRLSPKQVFKHQTISELATVVTTGASATAA